MLAIRKKASSVGDAVSSEQMRRAPDKNAGEVLRRVTGLSVTDGKYVFVRGLGERYSSTELDGVRIASPEQNKRVVPMDLFPAALLENIVVQKTYTADRSGEFGGGDVQIQTKDFPGKRLWTLSVSQGVEAGSTFKNRLTYASTGADVWGFGAGSRGIPAIVGEIAGNRPLTEGSGLGFPASTLQAVEKQFANVWTPTASRTIPNGSYTLTYGDQFQVLGHELGVAQAWSFARSFDRRDETFRLPNSAAGQAVVLKDDYQVQRFTESAQLGGNASLSYRLSPGSQVHVRGFYTNSADDEVRKYTGLNRDNGDPFYLRNTRLMYVQRDVLSGSVEGQHTVPSFLNSSFDWRFTRSSARRQQPDRRESEYLRVPTDPADPNSGYWGLVVGRREYGDLKDQGWGTTLKGAVPYRLGTLGNGKVAFGYDRQSKRRDNFYRRFDFIPGQFGSDAPPESVYDMVSEATLPQDNYRASQKVQAFFLSADVPLGRRLRGNLGVRHEDGQQDVVSHDLFDPSLVTSEGKLVNSDWLGGANLIWSVVDALNVRAAASRTLSRPDLDELSPRPTLDYIGDYQRLGNPRLKRAVIENYDLRVEAFPNVSEVLAASVFLKELHDPIENTVRGASSGFVLIPENSASGRNVGVEFEARASLGRLASALKGFSLNSNFSIISSHVKLKDSATKIGSQEHPLQGQANHLLNASLTYQSEGAGFEASVLVSAIGRRLVTLSNAAQGIPDHYDPGTTSLDVTFGVAPFRGGRLRFGASNLLDQRAREMIGTFESRAYRTGRSYSAAFSFGG
jgi:outer membrane receptor protein involved in Fe transport